MEKNKKEGKYMQDERQIEKQILIRMKWLPINQVIIYLCENLKDDKTPITSRCISQNLHFNHQKSYRILRDLEFLGFLNVEYRDTGLYSYTGVFKNKILKLTKFEKLARRRIEDLRELKNLKGGLKMEKENTIENLDNLELLREDSLEEERTIIIPKKVEEE